MAFYDTLDGTPNYWCNMRIQSLIVDGDITANSFTGSIATDAIVAGSVEADTLQADSLEFNAPLSTKKILGNQPELFSFTADAASAAAGPLSVRAIELGNVITLELKYPAGVAANTNGLRWNPPVGYPAKYLPGDGLIVTPCFVHNDASTEVGACNVEGDGSIVVNVLTAGALSSFTAGNNAYFSGSIIFSYINYL